MKRPRHTPSHYAGVAVAVLLLGFLAYVVVMLLVLLARGLWNLVF